MGTKADRLVKTVATSATNAGSKEIAAQEIASEIRRSLGYRWVGVYEVGSKDIYVLAWDGPFAPMHPRFPKTKGLSGQAVLARAVVRVDDVSQVDSYLTTLSSTRSEIIVPVLTVQMDVVGLIDVESDRVGAFSSEDAALLQACASALLPLWDKGASTLEVGNE